MAKLEVNGFDAMSLSLDAMATLPDSVLDEMLMAEAKVVTAAQKAKARAYGVHRTGMTLESIRATRARRVKDGKVIDIYPQGKNTDGNRNAEVAFVNEYGKHGQAPRPFIRDANEEAAEEAISAAEKVYENWLESQ